GKLRRPESFRRGTSWRAFHPGFGPKASAGTRGGKGPFRSQPEHVASGQFQPYSTQNKRSAQHRAIVSFSSGLSNYLTGFDPANFTIPRRGELWQPRRMTSAPVLVLVLSSICAAFAAEWEAGFSSAVITPD